MTAISNKLKDVRRDGKRVVEAFIVSSTNPDTLPTTGKDVDGMTENDVFAPMSIIYVVNPDAQVIYIADESGTFVQKT